jgi:ABC-type transport system substrate-binding protein
MTLRIAALACLALSCASRSVPVNEDQAALAAAVVDRLDVSYHDFDGSAWFALAGGAVDLVDDVLPDEGLPFFLGNPDFTVTDKEAERAWEALHFNFASKRWAMWGCDFEGGTSDCGREIRQGFAHLIDKAEHVAALDDTRVGGAIDDPVSSAMRPAASPPGTAAAWDTRHPGGASAYNLTPDPGGSPLPGSDDFCAAAEHMIAAGLARDKDERCVLIGVRPAVLAHQLRLVTTVVPFRVATSEAFAATVNTLFGRPVMVASPTTGGKVFGKRLPRDQWEMAEFAQSSILALNDLSAFLSEDPFDTDAVAIPELDAEIHAALAAPSPAGYIAHTLAAYDIIGARVAVIPLFERAQRAAYLRDVAGVVEIPGVSVVNPFTAVAAHDDPNFVPANARYRFGGGDPALLRVAALGGTDALNPFQVFTFSEFQLLSQIYAPLLAEDPVDPAQLLPRAATVATIANPPDAPPATAATHRFSLTGGSFHDGNAVTAADVKFTLLAMRDLDWSPWIVDAAVRDDATVDVFFDIAGLLPLYSTAGTFIVPHALWEVAGDGSYGEVGRIDPAKLDGFDVVAGGLLVGSGSFACVDAQGRAGGGCTSTGRAFLGPGDAIHLVRAPQP